MAQTLTEALQAVTGRPDGVVTVDEGATVHDAVKVMRDHRVGALVVTDAAGRVVGIASERDLVNQVLSELMDPLTTSVTAVMTPDPATCRPATPLNEAQEIMMARGIRHLPVVDECGRPAGMVSSRDVLAHQVLCDRAMRGAAEQVAMLSTCLKSLDFDEVVDVVAEKVPDIFGAERAVLFFPARKQESVEPLLIQPHRCPCPDIDLAARHDFSGDLRRHRPERTSAPDACRKLGCAETNLVIPLEVFGLEETSDLAQRGARGILCMCGLARSATLLGELVEYKIALTREVLNSNLTNAKLYQKAKHDALTDTLTRVGSRRLFEQKLEEELSRAERYRRGFCVVMADIDDFKSINDRAGHVRGDDVLRMFARMMSEQKRNQDTLARYGGDEFVLLMPETRLDGGVELAERVRLQTNTIPRPDGLPMTVSCGVAAWIPDSEIGAQSLVRNADLALYEAKRQGRNRVKAWGESLSEMDAALRVDRDRIEDLHQRIEEMSKRSKDIFVQSIWGLVRALEARDTYTRSHSENVMRYSVALAETLAIPPEDIAVIRRAAMIHDVGKIGVPDHILRKPTRLTGEERAIMEKHPLIAVAILAQMRFLERELPIVRHHHERWDGEGYPDGTSGESIPLGARILAVADAFDAITSDRVYRKARSVQEALEILVECSGTQFDPKVSEAMLRWVETVSRRLDKVGCIEASDLLESQKACTVAA